MDEGFDAILLSHLNRYPAMQLVDVYKLAYQASLGSQHAILNPAEAQRWLDEELGRLEPGPDEPLLDPIAPDGSILRIHLRPFLAAGGKPEALIQAFVQTANEYSGMLTKLEAYWEATLNLAEKDLIPFKATEAFSFWHAMTAQKYPAAHHSPAFKSAYLPAYRVVASQFWQAT